MRIILLILSLLIVNLPAADRDTIAQISPEMTKALNKGLKYLASQQKPDGSWSAQYGKNVGETSLCLMAFMAQGHLPGEGEYGKVVGKGVHWVLQQAKPSGLIQFTEQSYQAAVMYGHALATLMLSEAWGQTRRKDVGKVLRNAVKLILQVQGPKGGWGYKSKPQDGDTSVCVMQVIALKSAQDAGIYVPEATIKKALTFIKTRYNEKKKMFGYSNTNIDPKLIGSSAAGTCIMIICGEQDKKYTNESLVPLHDIMKKDLDKSQCSHKAYFMYYASVASFLSGSETYKPWAKMLDEYLLKKQEAKGSWGHLYKTAFCVLAGSLPYQYLPVYQK